MDENVHVQVDPRGFIHVVYSGELNDSVAADSEAILLGMPEFANGMPVVADLSAVTALKVTTDTVVRIAQKRQGDENAVAIIAPEVTAYGMARMFEIVADLTESRVAVFRDEASALQSLTLAQREERR